MDWLYKFTSIPTILLTKNGDLLDTVLIEKHHAYSLCKEQFSRVQLEQSIRYLSNLIVWQKYKDRFQLIFENAFKISVILKPNGILEEFNQAALTFFGNKHETVVGSIFWEMPWAIQSKKTQAKVKAAMTAAIGGSVAYCKVEAEKPDRQLAMLDFSFTPFTNAEQEVAWILAEGYDSDPQLTHIVIISILNRRLGVITDLLNKL